MWIAKWHDKLSDKMKYVWFSDTSPQKQLSDIEKFDRAKQLKGKIRKVRIHIKKNLISANNQRRKVATVCYLIDTLKLRVGDEKDTDEADTVGATTLRPLHIQIKNDNRVSFNFLGKDSIPWRKEVKLPETIITNIKEFMGEAQSPIFKGVHSDTVSDFLSEAVKGLTAKVFRTYYSTYVVDDYLSESTIEIDSPDYLKKQTATIANLQAAVMCNHKRKLPKNWRRTLYKRVERLKTLKQQLHKKRTKELNRLNSNISDLQSRKQTTKRKETIKKYKAKYKQLKKNRYTPAQKERLSKMESRIKVMNETRDYNLNTSLKSYIDPRIFFQWTQKVDYDWRNIYPKTLQKKFSWIEQSNP
jgi:DNA topoisomerase-1